MRSTHVVTLLAVVLLGLVLWLSLDNSSSASEVLSSPNAGGARSQGEAPEALSGDAVAGADRGALHGARTAATEMLAAEAVPATEIVERGVEILAVQSFTQLPVVIESAWWWEEEQREVPSEAVGFDEALQESRVEELLSERAEALTPDEEARWFAPSLSRSGYVVLRSGSLWGSGFIRRADASPQLVSVATDINITARVVDESGKPVAGAHVALQHEYDAEYSHSLMTARSDERGLAVLRHVGPFDSGRDTLQVRRALVLAEPFADDVGVPLDFDALPSEPVELRLCAGGSVEVRPIDRNGDPYTSLLEVALDVAPDALESLEDFDLGGSTVHRETRDGVVLFPWVGVGGRIVVGGWSRAGNFQVAPVLVAGPARVGEHVVVRLPIDPSPPAIVARLLDAQGQPVADRLCDVRVEDDLERDELASRSDLRTDSEGRLRAPLRFESEGAVTLEVRVRDDSDGFPLVARRALAFQRLSSTVDLGDLRMSDAPILAAGRVVGPDGAAARGAVVSLFTLHRYAMYDGGTHVRWEQHWRHTVRTDAQGAFRMFGELESATFGLTAQAADLRGSLAEAAAGARDLLIEIRATGALCGRVEGASPGLAKNLDLVVEREDDDPTSAPDACSAEYFELSPSGEFCARDLVPGRYSVYVEPVSTGERLAFVGGVVVKANETTSDRRLDPLRISDASAVLLTVVEPDGTPVGEWQAAADGDEDEEERWSAWSDSALGRQLVSPPQTARRILLWSDAHRIASLNDPRGEQTVLLERATQTTVTLVDGLQRPPDPLRVLVQFTAAGEPEWLGDWASDTVDLGSDGSGSLLVRRTGQLRALLWLQDRDSGDASDFVSATLVEGERLAPGAKTHSIRIACDPQELADAIASLAR